MTLSLANLGSTGAGGAATPLAWAVAASVALHVAVIVGLPDLWTYSPAPATAPLNARLERGRARRAPPCGAGCRAARHRRARRPSGRPCDPVAKPTPRADRSERAARADAGDRRAGDRADEPAGADRARPRARRAARRSRGTASPTLAPRPGDDALDLGSLAQYRLALIGAAKRHRLLSGERRRARLAGTRDGAARHRRGRCGRRRAGAALERPRRARSAGAWRCCARRPRLTPLPPALRSREFSVDVPVLFELRGEGLRRGRAAPQAALAARTPPRGRRRGGCRCARRCAWL